MPRFLGRPPYGAETEPVEEFAFEEDTGSGAHDRHLWVNASYAMAVRITNSFATYGWVTRIRGVELGARSRTCRPRPSRPRAGWMRNARPRSRSATDAKSELSKMGFLGLIHRKNTDKATFIGAQTVHNPKKYEDPDATSSAALSARLPYIFASTRFAHYLKCMVRDWVGGTRDGAQIQQDLNTWLMQYIDGSPGTSTEEYKATHPLKEASVEIIPDPENPGQYRGNFRFIPHYQLEGMDVSMSMVAPAQGLTDRHDRPSTRFFRGATKCL
ncbi:type VI secretion system contractile sheath domain-containing protein [Sphingomonas sp. MMS24-JH45]